MSTQVNLSNYVVGEDAYDQVSETCSAFGKKVVMIIGDQGYEKARPYLEKVFEEGKLSFFDPLYYGGECTYENIEGLKKNQAVIEADMIFAIGGGRVIDATKFLGDQVGKPVFVFPTIASNCSPCTSVSIIYDQSGAFIRPEFLKAPPICAFIQTKLLVEAPPKYLWAGLGDTYAKHYEASISARGETLNHPLSLGIHISKACSEAILDHGREALQANEKQVLCDAFDQAVLTIIVTTALVSILVTLDHSPNYNSGLAHAIYYTLTTVPGFDSEKHLHGEMVAFGVLILLLVDGQKEEFERVYAFNQKTKLPCQLADLDLDLEKIAGVLDIVTKMDDIKKNPYPITLTILQKAFADLEAYALKQCK